MNEQAQSQVEVLEAENVELRELSGVKNLISELERQREEWRERADKLQVELDEAKKQVQRERDWRHEAVGYERAKAAAAREREDGLRTQLASLAADFDRREREAKAEAADAPSEQVQHREEGISLAFGAAAGDLRTALEGEEDR